MSKVRKNRMVDVMEVLIKLAKGKDLRIQPQTKDWCRLPYPGHPKGCPNYGTKEGCPPNTPMLGDMFDLDSPVLLVIVKFDLAAHMTAMWAAHPDWTDRQARCCLYWQGSVRKRLNEAVGGLLAWYENLTCNSCPEALGLNVLRTLNLMGIPARKNPKRYVYKVALLGYRKAN